MKIRIDKADCIASCANCNEKNYDVMIGRNDTIIYEVRIGNMVNRICRNCLGELIGKSIVALATDVN